MNRRILSLLIFRTVLFAILSLFQALGPLIGFRPIPYKAYFVFSGVILALNWIALFLLRSGRFSGARQTIFIWLQLWFDLILVSFFVYYYGERFTAAPVFYVFVILMSTLFFSRISVYLVAIFSFISFYLMSLLSHGVLFGSVGNNLLNLDIFKVAGGYFIVFFTVAMLGNYLKQVFDDNYLTILSQKKEIYRLEFIRRKIIETLPSGLISINNHGAVSYANPAAIALLELKKDVLGKEIADIFPSVPALKFKEKKRVQCEMKIGGRIKTFGLAFSDVEWEEGIRGKLILFQDLTRIKLLEEQQLISTKMAAIGKVAAGVAHEIRNPLAALSGSVQVIGSMVPDNPTLEELVDIVQMETKRLNHIINEFLSYARPLNVDNFVEIDLLIVIESFLRLASVDPLLSIYQIDFAQEGEGPTIMGNKEQIMQILWNIIRNSCQASEKGQHIQLKMFSGEEEGGFIVEDHGEGMTSKEMKNVFTPFQRFRKGPGLGLGMSIVYEIMQLHSGKLEIDSKKGEGTTMRFFFPLCRESGKDRI